MTTQNIQKYLASLSHERKELDELKAKKKESDFQYYLRHGDFPE